MLTIFLSPSLIEQERHPFVTFSVPLHPYNTDLAERLKTVQVIARISTQSWIPAFAEEYPSHLGQKDARDKRARGKRPSHGEKVLEGNDGGLRPE